MRITRIYHPEELASGQEVELEAQAATHLTRVLRAKEKTSVILFNGNGSEYHTMITRIHRNRAWVKIQSYEIVNRESSLDITLAQGISRGERMDYTLQKAVELGITRFIPLYTERSITRLEAGRLEKRLKHWRGIAISACEQSGRNVIPEISNPENLDTWTTSTEKPSLRLVMEPVATCNLNGITFQNENIILVIGPEGGLSKNEIHLCTQQGFTGIRMGPRILRTETAAVSALSIMQGLWGDLA
ncbi:MAG TPA: 16S rRNA (uracil(1498)-N(3))-methyltransferase [Gammaproteobacteria bacterium]|nr:16S rRNA (uracil(1498)-N(3))-methyltransferase [Gammaproteobacteria bacterium]